MLATLHLPPDWYPAHVFRPKRDGYFLNCVSSSQERECPSCDVLLPHVPNGVPVERFRTKKKGDYVVALGRICPEKGFHSRLMQLKRPKVDMVLAGEVFPYQVHKTYFREQIAPRLNAKRRFLGPVGAKEKAALLAGARCLLVTSTVPETSSLVSMEALASGTPVVAFPSGALPEIIEHGRTGFLVENTDEMATAIEKVAHLNPEDRRWLPGRGFLRARMVRRYLAIYDDLIDSMSPRGCPVTGWNLMAGVVVSSSRGAHAGS